MDKELKIIPPEGYEIDRQNSTFDCIKFKPVNQQLPKTWEEFCKLYPAQEGGAYINNCSRVSQFSSGHKNFLTDKNVLPSEKYAEAMLALCQLIQLRDCYNDGWEPDWENSKEYKYTIYSTHGEITVGLHDVVSYVLSFKTRELRDTFFENFKDLLKIAKPLL